MVKGIERVKEHYSEVAQQSAEVAKDSVKQDEFLLVDSGSCCGVSSESMKEKLNEAGSQASKLYSDEILEGLPVGALVASRGCGDPIACADLQKDEIVLDLGSGGGIDAIIASRLVGAQGKVYGLDMLPDMIDLARHNAEAAQADNLEFICGNIEAIPLADESVNVVVSNCVINFSEDKRAVMNEAYRILKPGGRFVVSDIVEFLPIPDEVYDDMCLLTGCTNGLTNGENYKKILLEIGFSDAVIDPKTMYSKERLVEKAKKKSLEDVSQRVAKADTENVTGSAIIYAYK